MYPNPVIEYLNIFKDAPPGLRTGFEGAMVNKLDFQGMKETFHNSIVTAIAFATHGTNYAITPEELLISTARILAATIGVQK
jgi:hypothetical protein